MSTPAHEVAEALSRPLEVVAPVEAEAAHAPVTTVPARLPRYERQQWLAALGHAGLVWLVVYTQLASQQATVLAAALYAGLAAAVWIGAMSATTTATGRFAIALGDVGTLVLSVLGGLVGVSALATWLPGMHLTPGRLLMTAVAIAVLTSAWNGFVARGLIPGRRVLLVGGGAGSAEVAQVLRENNAGLEPVGIVGDEASAELFAGVPVRGRLADLAAVVREERPDLVVVCADRNRPAIFRQLLASSSAGFRVVGLPEFYEHVFGRVPIRQLTPAWFMSVMHLYQQPYPRIAKRTFDVLVASIGLLLTAPLLPVLAVVVAQSRGPVIYRQRRLGQGGRIFTIFKFRTMREDAEAGTATWAEQDDPRVTRVGRWLRRTRLDELPQLFNVLKGDMSVVGPRPERPEFSALLEQAVPYWEHRALLKPGITGWAQVRSGYSSDCLSTEEKLSYDLWYLRHRSMLLDLIICAKTLPQLLTGRGAR